MPRHSRLGDGNFSCVAVPNNRTRPIPFINCITKKKVISICSFRICVDLCLNPCSAFLIDLTLGEHLQILGEGGGYMCKSGISDTKPAFAYLWNKAVNSQSSYRVSIETRIWPIDWWQIWWPIAWPLTCVLVLQLITQEQIDVGSSNLMKGLIMWPAMNGYWPRSKIKVTTYQHNSATQGGINFKLGG